MSVKKEKTIQEKVEGWLEDRLEGYNVEGCINDPYAIVKNWDAPEDWVKVLPRYIEADYLPAVKYMHCRHGLCVQTSNPGPRVKDWLESRIPKRWAPLTVETFELWDKYTTLELQKEAWPYAYPPKEYIWWLARRGEYERANELISAN